MNIKANTKLNARILDQLHRDTNNTLYNNFTREEVEAAMVRVYNRAAGSKWFSYSVMVEVLTNEVAGELEKIKRRRN